MKTSLAPRLLACLVALVAAVGLSATLGHGCASTDVGNPVDPDPIGPEHLALEFAAYDSTHASNDSQDSATDPVLSPTGTGASLDPRSPETDPGELVVLEAWLAFERVALEGSAGCVQLAEQTGPVVVELISRREWPPVTLAAPPSRVCQLQLAPAPLDEAQRPDEVPTALAGASLLVIGQRADGAVFQLRTTLRAPLLFAAASDEVSEETPRFTLAADLSSVLVSFDLAGWFDTDTRMRLDALPVETLANIDEASEPALLAALEVALRTSSAVLPDRNADGAVQADELAEALARGR